MKKTLYRLFAQFLMSLLLVFGAPAVATAHVLKQNNGISAVLHIPPEDNPTTGQPTELDIAYGDKTGAFSLMNCDCQVMITSGSKVVQTIKADPALKGATLDSAVTVTFPTAGPYHVIATGKSKDGSFRSFKLDYLIRTSMPASAISADKPSAEIIIISAGSLIILAMLAYTSISFGHRYQRAKSQRDKIKK
jgi:hypothetical protein